MGEVVRFQRGLSADDDKQAGMKNKTAPGFTALPDDILEALPASGLSGVQLSLVLVIVRKTFGWNKQWDYICGDQLAEATGIRRQYCSTVLNTLIALNVVERKGGSRSPVRINPDISAWIRPEKDSKNNRVTQKLKNASVTQNISHSVTQKMGHTINRETNISNSNELDCHQAGENPSVDQPKKPAKRSQPAPCQKIFDLYNQTIRDEHPRAQVLNNKRKTLIKTFWRALNQDLSAVERYFQFFNNTRDFYRGNNDRGWIADFDYILRESTVTKARENTL